jgi:hypothetical protein
MLQYFDTLTDAAGNALFGATLQVLYASGGGQAPIYSTNGTANPIANSTVSADITGQVSFYVPDGVYELVYSYQGTQYKTRSPVQLMDPIAFIALTDTGSANAYVINSSLLPAQLYTGLKVHMQAANQNSGTSGSTLNVNGTGAVAITMPGGLTIAAGVIKDGGLYHFEYDGTDWQFIGGGFLTPPQQVTGWGTPTGAGVVSNYSGSSATLAQTSEVVAQIITTLKALGLFGT